MEDLQTNEVPKNVQLTLDQVNEYMTDDGLYSTATGFAIVAALNGRPGSFVIELPAIPEDEGFERPLEQDETHHRFRPNLHQVIKYLLLTSGIHVGAFYVESDNYVGMTVSITLS